MPRVGESREKVSWVQGLGWGWWSFPLLLPAPTLSRGRGPTVACSVIRCWAWRLQQPLCLTGLPRGASGDETACQCGRHRRGGPDPWVGKTPWRRAWQPTPVFLPGQSPGQEPGRSVHRVAKSRTRLKQLSVFHVTAACVCV